LTGLTANNRVYDGTTAATVTIAGAALNGTIAGDMVQLDAANYSALFGDRNVGSGKFVSVTGFGLSGLDAGNYLLTQPTGLTANITPRPITITATSNTKYFDATTGAAAIPALAGDLVGGDAFTLLGERYFTSEVGTGITLMPFADIADGNGGNNYAVTFVNSSTGVIQKHPSTVAEDVASFGASTLDDTVAAAALSAHAREQSTKGEACVAEDSENCVVGEAASSTPRVISSGIKLPQGVASSQKDRATDVKW
jgi:hypothetical protein